MNQALVQTLSLESLQTETFSVIDRYSLSYKGKFPGKRSVPIGVGVGGSWLISGLEKVWVGRNACTQRTLLSVHTGTVRPEDLHIPL